MSQASDTANEVVARLQPQLDAISAQVTALDARTRAVERAIDRDYPTREQVQEMFAEYDERAIKPIRGPLGVITKTILTLSITLVFGLLAKIGGIV